jgi:hypothetical protein
MFGSENWKSHIDARKEGIYNRARGARQGEREMEECKRFVRNALKMSIKKSSGNHC